MQLVKFKDLELNEIHYGYVDEEGDVVCGCCGGVFETEEEGVIFQILDRYSLGEEEIKEIMGE